MTSPKAETNKKFVPSQDYKDNYDRIFKKNEPKTSDLFRSNDTMPTTPKEANEPLPKRT
jgi:hypothetical protein